MAAERAGQHTNVKGTDAAAGQEPQRARGGYPWPWTGYGDNPDEMPLAGYAALLGGYLIIFGPLFSRQWSRRDNFDGATAGDVILFGVATHKLGRIVTKDWVTSPIRAPFTEYVGSTGGGEVKEQARGHGLQRAVGDLLTCPWCIAPWIAGTLYSLFSVNPRSARMLASAFTSVALSDLLQHGYGRIKKASK